MKEQLKELDFTPGIRAKDINDNFQLIYKWLQRERLRVGGWGIVEGFDIQCDPENMTVEVSDGLFINKQGEEITVPAKTIYASEIGFKDNITYDYKVSSLGIITLHDPVYDKYHRKYLSFTIDNPVDYPENIFYVRDLDLLPIEVMEVSGRNIKVSTIYKDLTVSVTQTIGYNRIDGIFLDKEGQYHEFLDDNEARRYLLESINSDSPSHVDLGDYDNMFCIGIIYWTITDNGIKAEVFTNHRSYRKVYVDPENDLWLKEELYNKQKFIYFHEPEPEERQPNDLWYNKKDNTLYIWTYIHGTYGWTIVNDHSEVIIRRKKIWKPEENPEDLATFKFADELDLHFVPGNNELTITVDCAPIMDDMYTELISTESEIEDYKNRIEEIDSTLSVHRSTLDDLIYTRDNLQTNLQVLKTTLEENAALYPVNYTAGTSDTYIVNDADMPNLRSLVARDLDVAEKLDILSSVLTDIYKLQEEIEDLEQEKEGIQGILRGAYSATGIGFRLKRPLTHPAYVEAMITHSVRSKSAMETFQKAAIFVKEGDISVTRAGREQLFSTTSLFSLGDEQLEIFVDGIKLSKGNQDFYEVVDYIDDTNSSIYMLNYNYSSDEHRNTYYGESSSHFRIMNTLAVGQKISYRISKYVWSYAQLDKVIEGIRNYAFLAYERAQQAKDAADEFYEYVDSAVSVVSSMVDGFLEDFGQISNYYKKGTQISWSDTNVVVQNNVMGAPIDLLINLSTSKVSYNLTGVRTVTSGGVMTDGDYFNVYYMDPYYESANCRMLTRKAPGRDLIDCDYSLASNGSDTTLTLENTALNDEAGAKLYITGFKRGR